MDSNRDIARRVYSSIEGRALLMDLLNDLKFFDKLETETDLALHNKSLDLLFKLGIWQEHNIVRIVNALMNMPYMKEKTDG